MKRKLVAALSFLVLAAVLISFLRIKVISQGDPDRYYHIELSRLTAQSGQLFLRSLPQVEDLGWGTDFVDKEFLFHIFTTLGYRAGGEVGVEYTSFLFVLLSLLLFYGYAITRISIPAAIAATVLVFSNPFLAARLPLLRPHTLAVLMFLLLNVTVLLRKPRLTGLACFLFVLSYHAFYVPMACMLAVFVFSVLDEPVEARSWRRLSLFGLFGSVAGVLANPYFPGNVALAMIHARIPELMQTDLKAATFGEELFPVRADMHFLLFHGPLIAVFIAIFALGVDLAQRSSAVKASRVRLIYLLSVALFFLAVSFQIARAGEYLVPACGLILVVVVERWAQFRKITAAVLCIAAIAQTILMANLLKGNLRTSNDDRVRETFKAIAALPAEAKGSKVFNCEWDRAPYLFYMRPDVRFVDILDPSLLYFENVGAYRSREQLHNGTVADAYGLIHDAFKADYVLCGDQGINAQLRTDPGFQQIYPTVFSVTQSPIVLSLFRVLPNPVPNYVRKVRISEPVSVDDALLATLHPPKGRLAGKELELEKTPYLNLAALLIKRDKAGENIHCAFYTPLESEVERLKGASFLGVGGGQGLKVWVNGRAVFSTRAGFPTDRLIQTLIPLKTPLQKDDKIDLLACSAPGSPFWGLALSFWSQHDLAEMCRLKSQAMAAPTVDTSAWAYQGLQTLTCIGPLAAPMTSQEFLSNSRAVTPAGKTH
jgi:hypothetical protein